MYLTKVPKRSFFGTGKGKKINSLLHGIKEPTKSIEELIAIHLIFEVISAGFCIKNYSRKVLSILLCIQNEEQQQLTAHEQGIDYLSFIYFFSEPPHLSFNQHRVYF